MEIKSLSFPEDKKAIPRVDRLLLYAIIKSTLPHKCVELGFGVSTRTILEALPEDSILISYDLVDMENPINDKRFIFKKKDQIEYEEDNVDFVFIDASHDFEKNIQTFVKIDKSLNSGGIIVVHDTGTVKEDIKIGDGYFLDGEYIHRPGERKFVNWIKENYPDYQIIHFHSLKEYRPGITIIQKYQRLKI